jgi:prepilin-type N-terminal cleavage/methylation domain-containing protein
MKDWKASGFTLVEILVVLAVAGLITTGLINFMVSQTRSYNVQEEIKEMEHNARLAMEIISKRLMVSAPADIDTDPNGNGAPGTFEAGDDILIGVDKFKFRPVSGDPAVDEDSECIYHRNQIDSDLNNKQIAYFITQDFDGDGTPDTPIFTYDPANPRVVTVTIIARTRNRDPRYPQNGGYRQMVLTKRVLLRNS